MGSALRLKSCKTAGTNEVAEAQGSTVSRYKTPGLPLGRPTWGATVSTQSAQWNRTARLLRRSGFGTTGAAVDAVASRGDLSATIADMLDQPFDEDPGTLLTPIPELKSTLPPAGTTDREDFRRKLRHQTQELTGWWLRRMLAVEQPLIEKLTFLWHNHFATSTSPVRSAELMATQNTTIRRLCLGDFRALAYAMLTDGAMLRWLNGNANRAKSPNENLAREFMELFALGHGNGYSEADIREAARALTGWIVGRNGSVEFVPDRHDAKSKTILGATGNFDASEFCDIVLNQPGSAPFVATSLWQQLASDSPPTPDVLDRLVSSYGPGRNLKSLTHAVLSDKQFLDKRATVINGPVDWYIGLLRTLAVSLEDSKRNAEVVTTLRSLGQLPFYPPTVGGWPSGRAWLSTGAAGTRIAAATAAAKWGDISAVADVSAEGRIEAVGYLLGIGSWSDRSAEAMRGYKRDPAALLVAAANTPEYLTT